ncbi:MAG: ABC transporter permease [Oculatellaceae cyanobacterium Prado106]|nr:ABC transporter permease [Oculatellaceae cyanobacterium Prado106]
MTWRTLSRDWIRSGLTAFGVFMGVAAVSATLNIQSMTRAQIELKLAERDKPYLAPFISPTDRFALPEIDQNDAQALQKAFPQIRSISLTSSVSTISSVQFESQTVEGVMGQSVTLNYLETTGRRMLKGRFFNFIDFDGYLPVAIADERLASTLFQGQDPIGKAVYTGGNRLVIIGVTQTKSDGSGAESQGVLWVTERYASLIQGSFNYSTLQISPHRLEEIPALKTLVEQFFQQRFPQASVYLYDNSSDLLKEQETQAIAARGLMIVGLVALAIGGVGIANITVASVLERTKEIGIRRAIGATRLEIMAQFILEAIAVSIAGGAIAVISVHYVTQVVTTTIVQLPYEFSTENAGLAMTAAIAVGVGSSFFPALRATRINIITALRTE